MPRLAPVTTAATAWCASGTLASVLPDVSRRGSPGWGSTRPEAARMGVVTAFRKPSSAASARRLSRMRAWWIASGTLMIGVAVSTLTVVRILAMVRDRAGT